MPHRYQGPPPPQRSNWSKLNSSQRSYAIKQYNIGRARRNLPLFVLGGGGDRINSSASEQDSEQSSTASRNHGSNQEVDDTDSLRTPSVDWSVDSVFGDEYDSNFDHIISADDAVAGTSAAGGLSNQELWPHLPSGGIHMASNVSSSKRGPEEQISSSGESKKQKTNGMELPGTGESGGSDPDTGNPSPENSVIPRPIQSVNGYKLVFRKNHSLLSYGLAWKISKLDGTSKSYLTTTSLMSLPVEQPYFYMSPAEFEWLPRGAICKHVKVSVVMRNPRTAFETNSSSTTLATLNQNKFIAIGEALNLKTRGVDRAMKFGSSTAAMVNQGTEEYIKSHHEKFIQAAYGSTTKAPVFQEGFKALPCSSLMLPMMLNRYFCTVATNDAVNKDIGWPNLSHHIRKGDASFLTGKTVVNYSYTPTCGYLSQPFQMRVNGYYGDESSEFSNNSITVINKSGNLLSSIVQTDLASGSMRQSDNNIIDYESGEWENLAKRNGSHYMTPIEKSQYVMNGPRDAGKSHVQPSLHVGVFPVPRMTTNELKTVPENYTDIEVQWDVQCEMVVEFGYGTMNLTHYDKPYLVNIENAAYGASISSDKNTYFQDQYSSVNGEYVCRVKKST